ncbi:hypothetical protein DUNSADRAFT_13743, partial [Dunaliella salina]
LYFPRYCDPLTKALEMQSSRAPTSAQQAAAGHTTENPLKEDSADVAAPAGIQLSELKSQQFSPTMNRSVLCQVCA